MVNSTFGIAPDGKRSGAEQRHIGAELPVHRKVDSPRRAGGGREAQVQGCAVSLKPFVGFKGVNEQCFITIA